MPDCYASPGMASADGKTVFLVPTGDKTIFFDTKGASAKQITDGFAETILIVVADAEHAVPWTKPEDLEIDPQDPAAGLAEDHGFITIAWADGSVVRLSGDKASLWHSFTRAGHDKAALTTVGPAQPAPPPEPAK